MREHVKADEEFVREDVPGRRARSTRFREEGQDYKVELIEDLVRDQAVDTVSLYTNGPFTDLCRGPHAPSTEADRGVQAAVGGRRLLARRLEPPDAHARLRDGVLQAQGARGAPASRLEEARARDHRKLGRELGLFFLSDLSPGSPFWQPNGMAIWNELTALWRQENERRDYREVKTPILYDVDLWKQSGPLGRVPREHVLHRGRGAGHGPQAHELPGARPDLQARRAAPTATCRSATPRPASSTATSRAARCTGCCASATSPRTTPTSSAPRSRSRRRSSAAWTSASRSTTCSASSRGSSSRRGPTSASAARRCGTAPRRRSSARSSTRASSSSSTRATARSTARRSTCT